MDKLKNKAILIGKEPGQGRLLISLKVNGKILNRTMGDIGCVPNSVSRCKPAEDVAHCKITIDSNGNMVVANLKPQNTTYVNGAEIASKKITKDSRLELGPDRYLVNVKEMLDMIKTSLNQLPVTPSEPKSIKCLDSVWLSYETSLEQIARKQQNKAKLIRTPMLIGSGSSLVSFAGGIATKIALPIALVSFLVMMYSFIKKDTSIEDKKKATDYLIDNYVCPHENCRHYLGQQPYKVVRQNKKCPYCGGQWIE